MSTDVSRALFAPRFHGIGGWVTAFVRVASGLVFLTFSLGKFTDHAREAADFHHYGIPIPDVSVVAVGTLELVGGVLLVVGLGTRVVAVLLAANMVGAIATAGRVDGGTFHLGVAPTLLVVMLFLVVAGAGALSLDERLVERGTPARP